MTRDRDAEALGEELLDALEGPLEDIAKATPDIATPAEQEAARKLLGRIRLRRRMGPP